jgi:alcohol dehydrogenase class IV
VLTDAASKIKKSLRHKTMTPDVAIVDPELTLSCPKALSAASGLDAFIQAFEGYTNPLANAATQALSAKACAKIFRNLERVCEKPDALDARTEMAEGSMLSAMAFAQTGLGAIHGLAHPVGSLLHVPHGVSCAILMPYVMAWNLPLCRDAYGDLAKACGLDSAEDFVRESAALAGRLGVPSDLKPYGLRREHFPFIVKNCRSASMASNPRPMDDDAVESLLSKTL